MEKLHEIAKKIGSMYEELKEEPDFIKVLAVDILMDEFSDHAEALVEEGVITRNEARDIARLYIDNDLVKEDD